MLQTLKENQNSENIEALISDLTNTLNEMLQVQNGNRKAIMDAIKAIKKD
jgi:hypothetical protein